MPTQNIESMLKEGTQWAKTALETTGEKIALNLSTSRSEDKSVSAEVTAENTTQILSSSKSDDKSASAASQGSAAKRLSEISRPKQGFAEGKWTTTFDASRSAIANSRNSLLKEGKRISPSNSSEAAVDSFRDRRKYQVDALPNNLLEASSKHRGKRISPSNSSDPGVASERLNQRISPSNSLEIGSRGSWERRRSREENVTNNLKPMQGGKITAATKEDNPAITQIWQSQKADTRIPAPLDPKKTGSSLVLMVDEYLKTATSEEKEEFSKGLIKEKPDNAKLSDIFAAEQALKKELEAQEVQTALRNARSKVENL